MKTSKIYQHTLPNGKSYIGQTCKDPFKRAGHNFSRYERCPYFYNAVQKYGAENVRTEILYRCETIEEANRLETLCISRFGTLVPNGYNLQSGGSNFTHSAESIAMMSSARSGVNNPMFGKTLSSEVRRQISEKLKGRKRPKAVCQKISEAQKRITDETRQKLSRAASGANNHMFGKTGENHPRYGIPRTSETKRKLSLANRLPEYDAVNSYFLLLPVDMPIQEKRKQLYIKYPNIRKRTIRHWVYKWTI